MTRTRWFLMIPIVALLLAVVSTSILNQPSAAASPAQQNGYYSYSVKFVCGRQGSDDPQLAVVRPGVYATEINIYNYGAKEASIKKRAIPLVVNGQAIGREPNYSRIQGEDSIVLPPETATMDDCYRITRILGMAPGTYVIGFLQLVSDRDLDVTAVYTSEGRNLNNTDIEVEQIPGKFVTQ